MVVQNLCTNVKYWKKHYIRLMDKLEEIRKKKFEQYSKRFLNGGNNKMEENMPNEPIKLSDADIKDTIGKYETLVVDCWAPWCGPCRMVSPVIDQLAKEMQGKIVFGKLNVDENPQTSTEHQIMSIPTLLVFKNGNLIDRLVGAYPKEELKRKLETY